MDEPTPTPSPRTTPPWRPAGDDPRGHLCGERWSRERAADCAVCGREVP